MKPNTIKDLKHGMRVTCVIEDTEIDDAKISINDDGGEYFICQDKMDGARAENKLGYKYSWIFDQDSIDKDINKIRIVEGASFDENDLMKMAECAWNSSIYWEAGMKLECAPMQEELNKLKKKGGEMRQLARKLLDADIRTLIKAEVLNNDLTIANSSFVLEFLLSRFKKELALEAKKLIKEKEE